MQTAKLCPLKKSLTLSILFIICVAQKIVAQIDTTKINRFTVYYFLSSRDSLRENLALKYIADNTSSTEPHTLMIASMLLSKKGYKDSSIYWLYLGEIRARFLVSL